MATSKPDTAEPLAINSGHAELEQTGHQSERPNGSVRKENGTDGEKSSGEELLPIRRRPKAIDLIAAPVKNELGAEMGRGLEKGLEKDVEAEKTENDAPLLEDGEVHEDGEAPEMNGFIPMEDPRFYFHPATNYVYDTITGAYSLWDVASQSYRAIPPAVPTIANNVTNMGLQVIEHAPESDATLTLVVIRSKLLQPGSIVLVDGKGLTIGRESSEFDRRLVLNELSVSRVHCSLFVDRVLETVPETMGTHERRSGRERSSSRDRSGMKNRRIEEAHPEQAAKGHDRVQDMASKLTAEIGARDKHRNHRDDSPVRSGKRRRDEEKDGYHHHHRHHHQRSGRRGSRSWSRSGSRSRTRSRSRFRSRSRSYDSYDSYDSDRSYGRRREKRARRTRREPTPPPKQRLADYFFVTDVGSTHGTTLNNVRLSEAKKASQPQMLKHGDVLAIGSTVLKAHIHPEWPCTDCRVTSNNVVSTEPRPKKATASVKTDPPPSQDSTNNSGNATDKTALEKTRRAELRRLKREALGGDASADKPKYIDRAALRRQMHGLSAEPPAAEIGYDTGIGGNSPAPSRAHQSSYNTPRRAYDDPTPYEDPPVMGVGGRMLQKMGWTAGQGLGAAGDGRVEPVAVTMRQNRVGLGMDHGASETMKGGDRHQHGKETLKQATMRKARERFLAMNDE